MPVRLYPACLPQMETFKLQMCTFSYTLYKKWTEEKEKNVGEQPCLTKKNYIKKIKFFLVSIKTEKINSVHREVVKFAVSIGKPKGGGHRRFYWK